MDDSEQLTVGKIPGRKSQALCCQRGGVVTVLAYFRSDEAAEKFMQLVNRHG